MPKGKKLITNTMLFTINAIGSRLMVFLLVPLYTHYMTNSEYGVGDLVYSTVTILLFIGTLKINASVIRFAGSKDYDSREVFNNAMFIIIISSLIIALCIVPVVMLFNLSRYFYYIPFIYFISGVRDIGAQYCKATGKTKIYAIEGVVSSALVLVFSLIFLVLLRMSIHGYLIAVLISHALSLPLLYYFGEIQVGWNGYKVRNTCMKEMLDYSIPLVPNSLSWWVVQLSDRYMVAGFISTAANGIYTIAYKIPSMMGVLTDIFIQAWVLSTIEEYDGERDFSGFSKVYACFETLLFIMSSLVICFNRPIAYILYGSEFYEAVHYSPLLVFALLFNNLQAFFGCFYNAAKKTKQLLYSSVGAAITNVALNLFLIPVIGIYGAIISTCISYLMIAVLRIIGSRKYVAFKIQYSYLVCNSIILLVQAINESLSSNNNMRVVVDIIVLGLILLINRIRIKDLLEMAVIIFKTRLYKVQK